MSTVFGSKEVKLRKPQHCIGCNDKYERGERMTVVKGINDGAFWSAYYCPICEAFEKLPGFWLDYEDGLQGGDFLEDRRYPAFRENFIKNYSKVLKPVLV